MLVGKNDNIIFDDIVRCNKFNYKVRIILTSDSLSFLKKKNFFSKKYILIDEIFLKDIKTKNGDILIRQNDSVVEIITKDKCLLIYFNKISDAINFSNIIFDLKKKCYWYNNITQDDVENVFNIIAFCVGIFGVISNNKDSKKLSNIFKGSFDEIIKFIKNKK